MTGAKARVTASGPKKLVSISRRTAATSPAISGAPVEIPALLISSVASDATRAASRIDASSVTSNRSGMTPGTSTRLGAAGRAVHLRPALHELGGQMPPEPPVGAGDDRDRVLQFHACSWSWRAVGRPQQLDYESNLNMGLR